MCHTDEFQDNCGHELWGTCEKLGFSSKCSGKPLKMPVQGNVRRASLGRIGKEQARRKSSLGDVAQMGGNCAIH